MVNTQRRQGEETTWNATVLPWFLSTIRPHYLQLYLHFLYIRGKFRTCSLMSLTQSKLSKLLSLSCPLVVVIYTADLGNDDDKTNYSTLIHNAGAPSGFCLQPSHGLLLLKQGGQSLEFSLQFLPRKKFLSFPGLLSLPLFFQKFFFF